MISYKPLFRTMKAKGITSYKLQKAGFSRSTYYSIQKGNSVSTNTINALCKILDCKVTDIIEYIDDRGLSFYGGFFIALPGGQQKKRINGKPWIR